MITVEKHKHLPATGRKSAFEESNPANCKMFLGWFMGQDRFADSFVEPLAETFDTFVAVEG